MKRSTPWGGKAREHWDCSQEPLQLRIRLACKISTNSQRLMSTPEDQPNTQGRRWLASGGGLKKPEYLYAAISSAKVGSSFSVPPVRHDNPHLQPSLPLTPRITEVQNFWCLFHTNFWGQTSSLGYSHHLDGLNLTPLPLFRLTLLLPSPSGRGVPTAVWTPFLYHLLHMTNNAPG